MFLSDIYIYIYTHIYTHTHIYIYIYIYIYRPLEKLMSNKVTFCALLL